MTHVLAFSSPHKCSGNVYLDPERRIFTIKGECRGGQVLKYQASAPVDFRLSRSGSGLPFPNPEIAYQGTPNQGTTTIHNGAFQFQIFYPSSYYVHNGSQLVQPHVHFTIDDSEYFKIQLGEASIANRSLKHLDGRPNRTIG